MAFIKMSNQEADSSAELYRAALVTHQAQRAPGLFSLMV